jgi:ribonuclease HI
MSGSSDLDAVVALERRLLDPATRADGDAVAALLHPDFREVGASGALWDRTAIIAALQADPGVPAGSMAAADARFVTDDVVLLTYALAGSVRSSLWVRGGPEGWQVRFHQGTPTG